MSVREAREAVEAFQHRLQNFNEAFVTAKARFDEAHDALLPEWEGELQASYDAAWGELMAAYGQYIMVDGPRFERFLEEQVAFFREFEECR